jgi:hypothetical protein
VFERLTEQARQVVVLAQEEARRLKHDYVGSEHLLLGLLAVPDSVAARALASLGITLELARERVVRTVGSGEQESPDAIRFTPRAKKLLALALEEALKLSDDYIGTEHILLAVVSEDEAVAAGILRDLGVDLEHVRHAVSETSLPAGARPRPRRSRQPDAWPKPTPPPATTTRGSRSPKPTRRPIAPRQSSRRRSAHRCLSQRGGRQTPRRSLTPWFVLSAASIIKLAQPATRVCPYASSVISTPRWRDGRPETGCTASGLNRLSSRMCGA